MPEMDGYDFVKWLRRETPSPMCATPVIMLTGHAASSKVIKSRDCGASFVVTKPLTPAVLLQRIRWLAKDEREFVQCESYVGPDRRVRNLGPPARHDGTASRRPVEPCRRGQGSQYGSVRDRRSDEAKASGPMIK